MFSKIITFPLAIMATLAGTGAASPITPPSSNAPAPAIHSARAPLRSGKFTFYMPGLGACGQVNTAADLIVALSAADFDPYTPNGNPNNNPLCGKNLRASFNGNSVDVTVVDRCQACGSGSLLLSPAAFDLLAPLSVGTVDGTWEWI